MNSKNKTKNEKIRDTLIQNDKFKFNIIELARIHETSQKNIKCIAIRLKQEGKKIFLSCLFLLIFFNIEAQTYKIKELAFDTTLTVKVLYDYKFVEVEDCSFTRYDNKMIVQFQEISFFFEVDSIVVSYHVEEIEGFRCQINKFYVTDDDGYKVDAYEYIFTDEGKPFERIFLLLCKATPMLPKRSYAFKLKQ